MTAMNLAARSSFAILVAAQWTFAAYVISFYGRAALRGELGPAMAGHLLVAAVLLIGGPLQFVPQLRRFRRLHRWSGRSYVLAVLLVSITGLYMTWSRGSDGPLIRQLAGSLHAVLLIGCAVLTVRRAMVRDFAAHRRWSLRLFLIANAGWFFRVGLFERIFLGQPRGEAFLSLWSAADYLLPLVLLEAYLFSGEPKDGRPSFHYHDASPKMQLRPRRIRCVHSSSVSGSSYVPAPPPRRIPVPSEAPAVGYPSTKLSA